MNYASNGNLALLISSCDRFSDLWDAHIDFLNQNWPDHPRETILVTDKDTERCFENVKVIAAGDNMEMPQRIKTALKNIESEYVFLTLDDYFLIQEVDEKKIRSIVTYMSEKKIDYIRLHKIPDSKKEIAEFPGLFWVDLDVNYAVNLYPGIWKKEFLESTIAESLSAWEFEVTLTQMARDKNARCAMCKNDVFVILDVVRKGKVLRKANRYFKKHGIDIGDRPLIPLSMAFKLKIIGWASINLPKPIADVTRKVMHIFGLKFFSDGTRKN